MLQLISNLEELQNNYTLPDDFNGQDKNMRKMFDLLAYIPFIDVIKSAVALRALIGC